jgi:hypothetical protein
MTPHLSIPCRRAPNDRSGAWDARSAELIAAGGGTNLVPLPVARWYHHPVDLNVKGLEPEVVARLSEQAAAEGLSQQQWVRQVLRRTAARLSPAELLAQRGAVAPMSEAEFTQLQERVVARRRASAQRLGAAGRGR